MRLTRIDLPGFGCLRDFRSELAPGLNVFYGMNEAGKSTLQQAVRALLYGFYAADRARPDETACHERYRPWEGGLYRGSLEYEMDDGRRFEVRRDFTTADVPTQLIDLFTGEDVSPSFGRGRHGNVPFARRHLGMSRTVFQSCAFISQGEIFHVAENGPKEIADAIAALADTAGRDVSATKAIERLKNSLQRVGSDRARTAELPKAREKLAAAEADLAVIDADRRALSLKAADLDRLQADLEGFKARIEQAEFDLMTARVSELTQRMDSLEEADSVVAKAEATRREIEPHARFPSDLRDDVLSLKSRWERAVESLVATRTTVAEAEERTPQTERIEFDALRTAVGSMNREQITELETIAYGRVRAWPVRLAIAIGRAITRAAKAVWRFIRRRPAPVEVPKDEPALSVSREEAHQLLERYRRYLLLAPAMERLRELQRRLDSEETDESAARNRLTYLLESAAVPVGADNIEEAVVAFLERCRLRERYERAVSDAEEAGKRIDLLLNGYSRGQYQAELERCTRRLSEMQKNRPALTDGRPKSGSRDLAQKLQELREERSRLELRAEGLRQEVQITMSKHRSRAEGEEEIESWRRRATELERAREAMRMAVAAIEEAMVSVYRDFAPAVNTFLSDGIERVTDGRYTRAHVDPKTLAISLLVPETGMVMQDPPVSHGTRTLAYVLMRIGLAQHMSSVGEPVPLVLDDPFVDVDPERLPRILDYLSDLSERMQVLIFTKDEQIVNWCRAHNTEGRHRIHELSLTVAATSAL